MSLLVATEPGSHAKPNEDWALVTSDLVVVLDGATVRTETGCRHGVPWYARQLGYAIAAEIAAEPKTQDLQGVLAHAIASVADRHPECDLTHPGTPSAACAIVHVTDDDLGFLVLGDTTLVLDTGNDLQVVTDHRVSETAQDERREADRLPDGSPEKHEALVRMKHAELAARNKPGGYWVAAASPEAAKHAITGCVPLTDVRRAAVLTDGAARVVDLFGSLDWRGALDVLAEKGTAGLIGEVRAVEGSDPHGDRWPRNKTSDDATVVYVTPDGQGVPGQAAVAE